MTFPNEEALSHVKDRDDKSADPGRRASDDSTGAVQKTVGQADSTAATAQSDVRTAGIEAMSFAETNVRDVFDLACKLVHAEDVQEPPALQPDSAKFRTATIREQAKEIGDPIEAASHHSAQPASQMRGTAINAGDESEAVSSSLEAPAIDEAAFRGSARERAELKGLEIARRDLAESGGTYTSGQAQRFLDISSVDEFRRLVESRSIISIRDRHRRNLFPIFQFSSDGKMVEGLGPVVKALPTENPWAIINFMTRPNPQLDGRKPIDLLKGGEVNLVIAAARRVGMQDA